MPSKCNLLKAEIQNCDLKPSNTQSSIKKFDLWIQLGSKANQSFGHKGLLSTNRLSWYMRLVDVVYILRLQSLLESLKILKCIVYQRWHLIKTTI